MDKDSDRKQTILICLILAAAVIAVYYQVCSYDFIEYDDPQYVYENPVIQKGFTHESVKWAFTAGQVAYWHPLTWLSHILDWKLFGANAGGHHFVNLVFHIANTILLFIVLARMTQSKLSSAFAVGLFALHPLHVESVAWVSERKDMLSAFFWILTMWAYTRYVEKSGFGNYLLIIVCYLCALMSKPIAMTLPFVLLLLDYWPLNRLEWNGPKDGPGYEIKENPQHKAGGLSILGRLVLEKIPLFIFAVLSGVITFFNQKKVGAMNVGQEWGFLVRIKNVPVSYLQYIKKTIWPDKLSFFYPHQAHEISSVKVIASVFVLILITIFVLVYIKKHRYLFTGWLWFLGTLIPVIGIIQVGDQAYADRYTYISLTGLFIMIAWGVPELIGKWKYRKEILWISSIAVLSVLGVLSYIQQKYWKNTETLCEHALEVTEDNFKAHFFLAKTFFSQGNNEGVLEQTREGLALKPDFVYLINLKGVTLSRMGRFDEAIECYRRELEIDPNRTHAYANIGFAYASGGQYEDAVKYYRKALESLDKPEIHNNLGDVLLRLEKYSEAVEEYKKVLLEIPDNAEIHNKLGFTFAYTGQYDEAIAHFKEALRIDPNHPGAKTNLELVTAERQKLQNKKAGD